MYIYLYTSCRPRNRTSLPNRRFSSFLLALTILIWQLMAAEIPVDVSQQIQELSRSISRKHASRASQISVRKIEGSRIYTYCSGTGCDEMASLGYI